MEYFKILNEDLNHYGFQYKEGLNIDRDGGSGLYFTTAYHILGYLEYGTKIGRVTIPEGTEIHGQYDGALYADRIMLSDIMDIWDIDNFKLMVEEWKIDIYRYGDWLVDIAKMESGDIELVDYIKLKQKIDNMSIK